MHDIWQAAPHGRTETTQPALPTCRAGQKEEEETEANIKINRTLGTKTTYKTAAERSHRSHESMV